MNTWNFYTSKEIKPEGWLKRQLTIQAEGLSGNLHKIWPDVRDSAWIGGEREGWERVPYWLDGFVPLAYLLEREDLIADAEKGESGFIDALFVEERLRGKGIGTYLLKEAEKYAKENGASMVFTNAGDWNLGFFQKNGYLIRGELKDVPKGHNCYELYKTI